MGWSNATGLSPRVLSALAHFGVTADDIDERGSVPMPEAARALSAIQRGTITLISGPSGSGKSTMLRALSSKAAERGQRVIRAPDVLSKFSHTRVMDVLAPERINEAIRRLSRVGLGDATLLAKRVHDLSDGQRARLALARAMLECEHAGGRAVVCIDEFTSGLDRSAARALCVSLHKAVVRERAAVAVVAATAHDDVVPWLAPTTHITVDMNHRAQRVENRAAEPPRVPVFIRQGTFDDYRRLSGLHYRAGRPARLVAGGVRVARVAGVDEPAGVLVVAMPTLNGRWRELAWPGRYSGADKRASARRMNRELRTIARVIVDSRFRGLGIGRRLIRTYLDDPLTPATEAVAAMGAASPMFSRAGMREYQLPPTLRDSRLVDALDARGLGVSDLLRVGWACERVERDAFLKRELARWVNASRATRNAGMSVRDQVEAAARSLGTPAIAYAHSAGS